jgi:sugar lactone lactonase YvrE
MQQLDCIFTLDNNDIGQPIWIESQRSLFWVDHADQQLYRFHDPSGELTCCQLDAPILSLSPRINHGFIATLTDGIGFFDMESRKVTYISKPEPFAGDTQTFSGVTDNQGNHWSFTLQPTARQSVPEAQTFSKTSSNTYSQQVKITQGISGETRHHYQLSPTMDIQRISNNQLECTAPPVFSKDGSTLYFCHGPSRYIYATHMNPQGAPLETQRLCRIPKQEGYPHGLCVDKDDCLWVCHREAGYISRYNKAGECLDKIRINAPGVKYCAFGGENLDKLFFVTAGEEDVGRARRKISLADKVLFFRPHQGDRRRAPRRHVGSQMFCED